MRKPPIDPDQEKFLIKRTEDILHEHPELRPLLDMLLTMAGKYAVLPVVEEDLPSLLKKGRFYPGKGARTMPGAPSQCHRNVSRLWEANKKLVAIFTGYALSSDGIWRQHSWGYVRLFDRIIETTERRTLYFGFRLTREEAKQFAEDN